MNAPPNGPAADAVAATLVLQTLIADVTVLKQQQQKHVNEWSEQRAMITNVQEVQRSNGGMLGALHQATVTLDNKITDVATKLDQLLLTIPMLARRRPKRGKK